MDREPLWQNREIRFDVDQRMLRLCGGEQLVDRMDNVEDTKGNNGDRGTIRITNIRLIWHATTMPRINLSIGWSCVQAIQTRFTQSSKHKDAEAIYVHARISGNSTKFEFVFTCLPPANHNRLITTMMSVYRAYETTRLYRELKMRGALIDDSENLRLLPQEQLAERVNGVWNLSQDQGSLGTMFITNCRVVWYASTNIQYNVSVPYLQMFSVRMRDSKFGQALVVETVPSSGEYVLGFRINPNEKLKAVCSQIQALMKAQFERPIFGVMLTREKPPTPRNIGDGDGLDPIEDDVETVEEKILRTDAFAAYFTEGTSGPATGEETRKLPVYSEELGLAVEPLKNGFTIGDLWNIRVE